MIIDCGSCAVAGLACDDCVVTVLLGMPGQAGAPEQVGAPEEPRMGLAGVPGDIAVDDEHVAALSALADAGLVPPLRLVPRTRAS